MTIMTATIVLMLTMVTSAGTALACPTTKISFPKMAYPSCSQYEPFPTTCPFLPQNLKLIEDITWNGVNSYDGGNVGWWALITFAEHDQIYSSPSGTYYFFATGTGTWTTYAGALSPNQGVVEPRDGSGTYSYVECTTFTASAFSPSYPTTGFVGTFNYGGTQAIVVLGTYAKQLAAVSSSIPFDPIANYFIYNTNTVNQINSNFFGSYAYEYNCHAMYDYNSCHAMYEYIFGNQPVVTIGDIVT